MKPEAQFEKDLELLAPHFGCVYFKVPDIVPLKRYGKIVAHRRPFDAVLVTPKRNYVIECKINTNKLSPHQEMNRERVDAINGTFVVLRKKFLKKGIIYIIELLDGKWKTDDIREVFIKLIKYGE